MATDSSTLGVPAALIASVRRYNRFYTQRLGLLNEHLDYSDWSLTEARVLYELAHRDSPVAAELARDLSLDPGYLSRMLRRFQAAGVVQRSRSTSDARRNHLVLTANGRKSFAALDASTRREIERLLAPLPRDGQETLARAMESIRLVLEPNGVPAIGLRDVVAGDIGWIVERHGALYASEFGYDASFEGLVAKIAGAFLENHDPARERGWIAIRDGLRVGSVLLVGADETTAKLRLLLVEPAARGSGIGQMLVDRCTTFARRAGYARITLWTQSHLAAARRIYEAAGYVRVAEEPHRSFGKDLVAETWTLELTRPETSDQPSFNTPRRT